MGQKYEYQRTNFEKFYDNTKQTDKILSMIMNIINLLLSLFNELSNGKNYENQFKLPSYHQDTTNYNIPYNNDKYTKYNEYKDVNEYYPDNEQLHLFFSRHNDIDKRLNVVIYEYPKDGKQCFNCRNNHSHQCCIACKRTVANCKCVFICGLSTPCQWDKRGSPCQFRKCKYYTSNAKDFNHECKGIILENNLIVTFNTQDSLSYQIYNV